MPTETALVWGLLYDLLCAPLWLYRLVRGQATAVVFLRPIARIAAFTAAARMTAALCAANLLGFALEIALRPHLSEAAFLRRFTLVPADLRHGHLLPLVTHLFAHASPMHLCGNLLTLFVFGRIVERHLGPLRTLLVYLGAASVSTALSLAAQVALHQSVPTLGASGAIAGLVALGILISPFTITFEALLPMPVFLLGWLAMMGDFSGVLSGRHDGIDHFAHLGGYLSVLAAYLLVDPDQRQRLRTGLLLNLATALLAGAFWLCST